MKRSDKVQLSWHAPDELALGPVPGGQKARRVEDGPALALSISHWPRDLAVELPEAPEEGTRALRDVLLQVFEFDAGAERGDGASAGDDPLATYRLWIDVDPAGKVVVHEAEDVTTDERVREALPEAWRLDTDRVAVAGRPMVVAIGPGPGGTPLELRLALCNPAGEERLEAAPSRQELASLEGDMYEVAVRVRRESQGKDEADLARAGPVPVRMTADDPTLTEETVTRLQLAFASRWRLGLCKDPAVFDRWRAVGARLRELDAARPRSPGDPGWESPAPFRQAEVSSSSAIIEHWLRGIGSGLRKEKKGAPPLPESERVGEYCGVTAAQLYMDAGVQPHWVSLFGFNNNGFLSTSRIPAVMRYRDPISLFYAVPVREVDGLPVPCGEEEVSDALLPMEELHRRHGARRLLLYFGDGLSSVSPEASAAREALFFPQSGQPERIRRGDLIVVGNDPKSVWGAHITVLEGACRGGCALCERDALPPDGPGPFIHLLEGNAGLRAAGTYQVWEPALERELDLSSGVVRDAQGRVEEGLNVREPAGRGALADRRLDERGVTDPRERAELRAQLVKGMAESTGTTHLARRRRRLTFDPARRAVGYDAPVIYAARFSPFDVRGDLPLVELVEPGEWSGPGALAKRARALQERARTSVPEGGLEVPRLLRDVAARWRDTSDAHNALHRAGPPTMSLAGWRRRLEELRMKGTPERPLDTPERAEPRIAAGLARLDRPDLLQWGAGLGAPDFPEGLGCQGLPFVLAVWAGQMTSYDARCLFGAIELDPPGPDGWRPEVEALGLSEPRGRWPEVHPRPGEVVVFTTAAQAGAYTHVTVATGVGDELLSLEPARGNGTACPLVRTTIGQYLERDHHETYGAQLGAGDEIAAADRPLVLVLPHRF